MSNEYHILSLSGGKDSTALAFFIKDKMPEIHEKIEYVFCDTEQELPETYDYLNKIEVFLNKPITRIKPYIGFDHLMQIYKYLPSVNRRWCTVELKTKPFRKYVYDKFQSNGEGSVNLYIGIRADEPQRAGYNKYGDNYIQENYPFFDNGIRRQDVLDILEQAGIGLPEYYKWSRRSGCYFCFFQPKINWIRLFEIHPDLFFKAKEFEDKKNINPDFPKVHWNMEMTLEEMILPENIKKIKEDYQKLQKKKVQNCVKSHSGKLIDMFDDNENTCLFCHL